MELRRILEGMQAGGPASNELLLQTEELLGVELPEDYRALVAEANGAEGPIGTEYVVLWPLEKLPSENAIAAEFIDGLVVFGSDGGGEAFAFDFRDPSRRPVVQIPFATYDPEDAQEVGDTFALWLDQLAGE